MSALHIVGEAAGDHATNLIFLAGVIRTIGWLSLLVFGLYHKRLLMTLVGAWGGAQSTAFTLENSGVYHGWMHGTGVWTLVLVASLPFVVLLVGTLLIYSKERANVWTRNPKWLW